MLSNLHTHTTFCDGENTPEEIVLYAIEKGFSSIGFSGHGYTSFDLTYCIKDMDKYIKTIHDLKEKFKSKIQVYCGVEEDAFSPVDRERFDYIIGSSHYFDVSGKYYPIDLSPDGFNECLKAFDYDIIKLAEAYYSNFCSYITKRKPDIVGHFDLITKYDEIDGQRFLNNSQYLKTAEKYMRESAKNDVIFEVNTGAISRGLRKTPYPYENLLYVLKESGAKVTLSSDSHSVNTLDAYFMESKKLLRHIGFDCIYIFYDGKFKKQSI